MLYIHRGMKTDTAASTEVPATDKRSRNKYVVGAVALFCGILFNRTEHFLADYHGHWGVRLALVLVPWMLVGVLFRISRRFYREDELEILINRQALAIAFYAAIFGFMVLSQLQQAGFVPRFEWTTGQVFMVLVLLMAGGILWSQRRYR